MKADPDKCIACKRCFPYCPMGRIQTFKRHEKIHGRVYIEIDQDACTDCGMCLRANICPVNALYQHGRGMAPGSPGDIKQSFDRVCRLSGAGPGDGRDEDQ